MARLEAGYVEEAMTGLQQRYREPLLRFVQPYLQDDHLAQDVVQDAFERVFTRSHHYRQGTCFRAWLFEIARNQALSVLRTKKRTPRPFSSFAVGSDEDDGWRFEERLAFDDARGLEEREMMEAFRAAVAALPERYRTVFRLCALEGLQYQQAAARLGVPTGTVAIRIMRARKRLFEALAQHLGRLRRPPACAQ